MAWDDLTDLFSSKFIFGYSKGALVDSITKGRFSIKNLQELKLQTKGVTCKALSAHFTR